MPDRARGTRLAAWVAAGVVGGAIALRWLVPAAGDTTLPAMRLLFAAAALCVAGLSVRRVVAVTWIMTITAAGLACIEIVAVARTGPASPFEAPALWAALVVLAEAATVVSAALAVAYASRPRRDVVDVPAALVRWLGMLAMVGLVAIAAWTSWLALTAPTLAIATVDGDVVTDVRTSARVGLLILLGGLLVGAAEDFTAPFRRARTRLRSAAGVGRGVGASLPAFGRLLVDELLPGNARRREALVEGERARIAADLHAMVLPELRRAAATAAAGDTAAGLAANLQRAVEDVEQLMHGRQSVVLEEFGLVAALEWLAERTESRGSLRVELELDGPDADTPADPPREVARVAFRVALLALDNVVRHAAASVATVTLRWSPAGLEMAIGDDGRGFEPAVAGRSAGGRGLADMVAEAAGVGASLRIDGAGGERGTRVALAWHRTPNADDHRTARRDIADRSQAPASGPST
jgi:signal transduction histidine kinase